MNVADETMEQHVLVRARQLPFSHKSIFEIQSNARVSDWLLCVTKYY